MAGMNSEAHWENMLMRVISIKKTRELKPDKCSGARWEECEEQHFRQRESKGEVSEVRSKIWVCSWSREESSMAGGRAGGRNVVYEAVKGWSTRVLLVSQERRCLSECGCGVN